MSSDSSTESKPKSKSKSKLKDRLTVVLDPGTSLSKILYVINDGTVKWMTMGAECLTLPATSASSLPIDNGMGRPSDNAWVRLSKAGECHLLGFVASNYRATTSIKKIKGEFLVFKILGTIGAIASREKLESSFDLELGVLLPLNEYHLAAESEADIKSALASFYFQNKRLRVKLRDFLAMPEGYGTAKYSAGCRDFKSFKEGNTAIVMFGYRNTSCLFFRRGTVSKPESGMTSLGFYTLLDRLIETFPSLERQDILKAIKIDFSESWARASNNQTYLTYSEKTILDFATLVKQKSGEDTLSQEAKIKSAYDLCLAEYWSLLKNWLDDILPRTLEIDAFVFTGGSYYNLSSHLDTYTRSLKAKHHYTGAADQLKRYLLWCDALDKERFMRENLALRFADAWGFFVDFADYDLKKILDRHTGKVIETDAD
jgi:hypothetical protein